MTLERWIRLIAGTFILVSLALSRLHSLCLPNTGTEHSG